MKKILFFLLSLFLYASNLFAYDFGSGFDEDELRINGKDIQFKERSTDPPIPGSPGIKLYAKNDSGTTTLYTIDSLGAVLPLGSGGGTGDMTAVGDVLSGDAFTGTQGTTLTYYNAGGNMTTAYDGTNLILSKPPSFESKIIYVDSAAKIQTAIDTLEAGSKGIVHLLPGTYSISSTIQINGDDITIEGSGTSTIIKQADGANLDEMIYDYTGNSFSIKDLVLDGNKSNQSGGSGYGIRDYEYTPNNNLKIENVWIHDTRGSAILSGTSSYVTFDNITINDAGGAGIDIQAAEDYFSITNCNIDGTSDSGIKLTGTQSSGCPSNFTIDHNIVSNVQTDQKSGIHVFGAYYGTISNNAVSDNANATHGINGIFFAGNRIVCSNNEIESVSGVGIEVNSGWAFDKGSGDSNLVNGNKIRLTGTGSDANGIWASGTNTSYIGNIIEDPTQYGIYVTSNGNNILISDNTIKNTKTSSAIYLTAGGQKNIQISNNKIIDTQNTPTTTYGIEDHGAKSVLIFGNTIDKMATSGILLEGSAAYTIIHDNLIKNTQNSGSAIDFDISSAPADSVQIFDNQFIDDQNTPTQLHGINIHPISTGSLAVVQTKVTNPVDNADSSSASFLSTPTATNTIVVSVFGWRSGQFAMPSGTVTDNQGNTYYQASEKESSNLGAAIFYAYNVASSGTFTITVNPTGTGNYFSWTATEISGTPTTDPFDKQSTNSGSSTTSPTTGATATLSQAAEIVFSAVTTTTTMTSITVESTSPTWNQLAEQLDAVSHEPGEIDEKIVASTTALTGNWTFNPAGIYAACIATFKQSPSPATNIQEFGNYYSGNTGSDTSGLPTGTVKTYDTMSMAQAIDTGLTASTAVYADSNKQLASSSTTPTELGYVHGVTSAIQTQIDGKQATLTTGNLTANSPLSFNNTRTVIGGATALTLDTSGTWSGNAATATTASTVTTNANLTGPVTSSGNATSIANSINLPASPTTTTQSQADNSTKIATTAYVDLAILGQNYKEACKYASTAALPTVVYSSGAGTLTGFSVGAISLDGSSPVVADRILIKNQASTFQNGIYTVTATGSGIAVFVLTRTSDANASVEFKTGDSVFITSGSTLSSTTWAYTGIDSPNFTSDAITYAQVAGQGSFTASNGVSISGTAISGVNAAADGSTKGVAAFNSTNFSASSGVVNTTQNINTTADFQVNSITANTGTMANNFTVGTSSSNNGTLIFRNATNTNTLKIQPGATASNLTFTLPNADGSSGQVIKSNAAGVLSFTSDIPGNAATVTTNANLTGPITSSGNATAIGAQTGTGNTFAMSASPTFTGTITYPSPFTLGSTSVTSTGTQLNYLNAATGTTGTTSTNLVFSTSPTLVTPALGAATYTTLSGGNVTDSGLTSGRITIGGTSGILTDDSNLTYSTTTSTITTGTLAGNVNANRVLENNNGITASGNAATVPVSKSLNTVTNNSAATLTITLTTAGATDGQVTKIRILDFSAAAQTITWVNTENSTVTAPTTSNGSTTLPLTVGFMYNGGTSKWRCIASA